MNELPQILINVEDRGSVRVIDFMKTKDNKPMKMYVSPSGHITLTQVSEMGVDSIEMHLTSFIAMLKCFDIDWESSFSGNYSLQRQKYLIGGPV